MKKKGIDLPVNTSEEITELLETLDKKQFYLKDINVSPRVHNSWRSAGIIPNAEADGKWATYDFYQYLWLRIVKDLRDFGLPINLLLKIKETLFKEITGEKIQANEKFESFLANFTEQERGIKVEKTDFNEGFYEQMMALAQNRFKSSVLGHLYYRSYTTFYIYLDGEIRTWSNIAEQVDPSLKPNTDKPHITIPLSHYFIEFLSDETKAEYLQTLPILSDEEREVLQTMRNNQLKEFTVKFIKNGKSRKVDIIKTKDGELSEEQSQQIIKILGLKNYEDITLKKNNGTKLYFERDKREKV